MRTEHLPPTSPMPEGVTDRACSPTPVAMPTPLPAASSDEALAAGRPKENSGGRVLCAASDTPAATAVPAPPGAEPADTRAPLASPWSCTRVHSTPDPAPKRSSTASTRSASLANNFVSAPGGARGTAASSTAHSPGRRGTIVGKATSRPSLSMAEMLAGERGAGSVAAARRASPILNAVGAGGGDMGAKPPKQVMTPSSSGMAAVSSTIGSATVAPASASAARCIAASRAAAHMAALAGMAASSRHSRAAAAGPPEFFLQWPRASASSDGQTPAGLLAPTPALDPVPERCAAIKASKDASTSDGLLPVALAASCAAMAASTHSPRALLRRLCCSLARAMSSIAGMQRSVASSSVPTCATSSTSVGTCSASVTPRPTSRGGCPSKRGGLRLPLAAADAIAPQRAPPSARSSSTAFRRRTA
mmetsp:Transcript_13135/g.55028  ORF Transcript_13135/g.55028 Transcript_13135/m.55028 type:complete len:420 (+) Transcript_13135:758-2017(+)